MRLVLLLTLPIATLAGCADDAVETAETSAGACADVPYDVTWANWGDGFFSNYCRACHSVNSEERFDAPEGINFDTKEEVILLKSLIHTEVIVDQTMPVGGGVYDQDLEFLGYLLECGLE